VQPETPTTFSFEDFAARKQARQTADDLTGQLAQSVARVKNGAPKPKRKPAPAAAEPEVPATLADVLRQAVALAIARRGNPAREAAIREQVLLEVLTDAMRRGDA
jgi:hypothetical protein